MLNIYGEYLEILDSEFTEEFNAALEQLRILFDKATELKEQKHQEMTDKMFKLLFKVRK